MVDRITHCPGKIDLSLQHLEAEMIRLDILLRREMQGWRMAGQDLAMRFVGST